MTHTLMVLAMLCGGDESAEGATATATATADGSRSLFDGTSLTGWDGDPRFWSVADGAIVGRTTADNPAERNTFLIHRGEPVADFDLRFEYQVQGFNSGVQYRSAEVGRWDVAGYQADFEARWHDADDGTKVDRFTGMVFDEQGRMFLAQRGQAVVVRGNPDEPDKPLVETVGSVGDPAELEQVVRRDGWNECRVIAKGFTFTHVVNGRVMAVAIDQDTRRRKARGILAFQLHAGPPMEIRLRNIRLRDLNDDG